MDCSSPKSMAPSASTKRPALVIDLGTVSAELLSWAPTLSRSPLQVLARLHTVAAARSLSDDQLEAGNLPRDEVRAALTELLRRHIPDDPAGSADRWPG